MKNKIIIYIFVAFVLLLGIILFNYAFPDLSVQRGVAAIMSIYCFSFAVGLFIKFGLSDIKNIDD